MGRPPFFVGACGTAREQGLAVVVGRVADRVGGGNATSNEMARAAPRGFIGTRWRPNCRTAHENRDRKSGADFDHLPLSGRSGQLRPSIDSSGWRARYRSSTSAASKSSSATERWGSCAARSWACSVSSVAANHGGTRDEVLEALWPELVRTRPGTLPSDDLFPATSFEPDYREGMSAGYVTYDGELVALSEVLCDSLSRRCWRAIRRTRQTRRPSSS